MKYIDGTQHCIIAKCDIAHWGWSKAIKYNCFSFYFYTKDAGRILNIDALRNLQIETKILFSYYAVGTSHYNSQTT